MTFVPPGGPSELPEEPAEDPWAGLREDLAADVRRVSDRLRNLSATRLASAPAPPPEGGPPYVTRAQAGRAAAAELARAATALEAGSGRPDLGHPTQPRQLPDLPVLSDLAVGDQVAVTGHDLLAAMDAVSPATTVWTSSYENPTAERAVRAAARVLADVRRRL